MILAADTAPGGLNYHPCRYGQSRVTFRGPRKQLRGRYLAFLGGTETYGQFVETPYPDLLDGQVGLPCVNLGVLNGGVDVLVNEPEILLAAGNAALTVMALPGVQNVSNRYYSVHPRRNDRFLRPSMELARLYPEVDFTDFHFARHLLLDLHALGEERFAQVVAELRRAWNARMRQIAAHLKGRMVLVWLLGAQQDGLAPVGPDPLFVTPGMVDGLRDRVRAVAMVRPSPAALAQGCRGMVHSDFEEGAAKALPGPMVHAEIARTLQPAITKALTV